MIEDRIHYLFAPGRLEERFRFFLKLSPCPACVIRRMRSSTWSS
ncbi:hypothetical protein AB1E33_16900 [Ruegeria sp. 2012CJ15-1]